jgi:hypothetical protein
MSATSNTQPDEETRRIFFRISIGGICLVFLVVLLAGRMIFEGFGDGAVMNSISDYYYSPSMHNVFVGGLCILAVLLMCYRYGKVDMLASLIAGIGAIGVAIFPKAPDSSNPVECPKPPPHVKQMCPTDLQNWIGTVHYASAALFLATIALMAFFLFTQSDQPKPIVGKKKQRNKVYRGSGFAMGILIIGCFLVQQFFLPGNSRLEWFRPVLWFEMGALVLFIFAWIVKGEVLWRDENQGKKTYLSEYLTYIRSIVPDAIDELRKAFLAKSSPGKSDATLPQASISEVEPPD